MCVYCFTVVFLNTTFDICILLYNCVSNNYLNSLFLTGFRICEHSFSMMDFSIHDSLFYYNVNLNRFIVCDHYHKKPQRDSFKQQKCVPSFWRLRLWNQGIDRDSFPSDFCQQAVLCIYCLPLVIYLRTFLCWGYYF